MNRREIAVLLDEFSKSTHGTNSFDPTISSNGYLIRLQEIYTRASMDTRFMSQISSNPRLLIDLGIKRSIHVNRILYKTIISPILSNISANGDIQSFSIWDEFLFLKHLQLIDNPSWFAEAFWDINRHAFGLVNRSTIPLQVSPSTNTNSHKGPLIFVLKGPAALAHFENFLIFIRSKEVASRAYDFRVVFLDADPNSVPSLPCKAFYFHHLPVHEKITSLNNLVFNTDCCCLLWVAAVQNLGLYLFSRIAPVQAYWSMKYHSVTSPCLDMLFRSATNSETRIIDNNPWYGIPSDFTQITKSLDSITLDKPKIDQFKSKLKILTLGRQVKINSAEFSDFIQSLLASGHFLYSYSGKSKALWDSRQGNKAAITPHVNYLGWLNIKGIKHHLRYADIYVDSFPFGGGHTCFYAMKMSVPVLMINTEQNRRCSYMMHLIDLINYFKLGHLNLELYGIFSEPKLLHEFLEHLSTIGTAESSSILSRISQRQSSIFSKWSNTSHIQNAYVTSFDRMLSRKLM